MSKEKTTPNKTKNARTFTSPWSRLSQEVHQSWNLRKGLIEKIERRLRGKVIVYFTALSEEEAMISDADAEMMENILSAEHDGGKVVLILNSTGGSGEAAERIVNVCRAYSNGQFEVMVPHSAKSAATMICFGASLIRMSCTAELGPVDPQVKYISDMGNPVWISAAEYVRSYEKLMEAATSGTAKRLETLIQQLSRYDARHIEQLKSAQALSESISVNALKSGMMAHLSNDKIRERIAPFLIQAQTISHGRMISINEAKKCGLRVQEIKLQSLLWRQLWELYVRASWVVLTQSLKILESNRTSLGVAKERRNEE
jgi:ClpP class serine protease